MQHCILFCTSSFVRESLPRSSAKRFVQLAFVHHYTKTNSSRESKCTYVMYFLIKSNDTATSTNIVLTVLLVCLSLALQCFLTSNDTAMTLYVNDMFIPVRTTCFYLLMNYKDVQSTPTTCAASFLDELEKPFFIFFRMCDVTLLPDPLPSK